MAEQRPVAIVDIGSNSVRLVVYSGATRSPSILFNEKVSAGLGRGLAADGALTAESRRRALAGLARFALLLRRMEVARLRVVATAAVREASNGAEFLDEVRALGLEPELLSGEDEAEMAALGVASAIPEADGVVGDLGGGSLELADLSGGRVGKRVSLPLGVLRIAGAAAKGEVRKLVGDAVAEAGFEGACGGRAFYMVGGSWRALAKLDMVLARHPLPIAHQHEMPPDRPQALEKAIERLGTVRGAPRLLSPSRLRTMPAANSLLAAIAETLGPDRLIVSAFGIREGLLYADLPSEARAADPLIEAAREAGTAMGRFGGEGDRLDAWIAPVFADPPERARLRRAACLLVDIAWQAHPDFRAERGLDLALHGNWVGIDAPGRVLLGQALFAGFGGRGLPDPALAALCAPAELDRAAAWGLAMRLGRRLSAGVPAGLSTSRLSLEGGALRLEIDRDAAALYAEPVERRLAALAEALGATPELALV